MAEELWRWLNDATRCARCGIAFTEWLLPQRHHLVPRSEKGEGIEGNVVLLCANCHSFLHRRKMRTAGGQKNSSNPVIRELVAPYERWDSQCPGYAAVAQSLKVTDVTEFSKTIAITLVCVLGVESCSCVRTGEHRLGGRCETWIEPAFRPARGSPMMSWG